MAKLALLSFVAFVVLASPIRFTEANKAVLQEPCYPDFERVDCHPDKGPTEERCLERGCHYCSATIPDVNVPSCYFPKSWGYSMVGSPVDTGNGFRVNLSRTTTDTLFGGDIQELLLTAEFQSDYRLRVKIVDANAARWEVPLQVDPPAGPPTSSRLYDVIFLNNPTFSFKVLRRATGTTLFDSSLGGFTFSDQFIQIGWKLPSRNVYGIGENEQPTFRHHFEKFNWWALWARDAPPTNNGLNIYGVQPHYTVLEDEGNAHAVAIVNSNAQEFVMHPNPGMVYRTIGGVLDMYFFLGPTPENTVQQYTEAVGRFPLPPYWSLGFHLCRFGYNTLANLKAVVDRTIAAEIPYDVQYGDIDIMDRRLDFTVDPINFPGLNNYVKGELREKGVRWMTILDPAVSNGEPAGTYPCYELGNDMDVWVKRPDGSYAVGRVWPPDPVHFPDYFKNETIEWWKICIKDWERDILTFDALWIDMNEPANFVDGDIEGCGTNGINQPPYTPRIRDDDLIKMTLCPDYLHNISNQMVTHYDAHSLYGWSESEPTLIAAREALGRRTFILSRSTFIGTGRWATHWLGDNFSDWPNLRASIIGMLQFNLFGMPFVGPDICGHNLNATAELCGRWMQLGAFYPFSRNHNGFEHIDQDPAAFNGTIIEISRSALLIRYRLLPYLYTLLATHSMHGNTVARALWHEFPTDAEAAGIDRQFLWGSGFMISPAVDETTPTMVHAYIPDARWYDYYTGSELPAIVRGEYINIDTPLTHIPLHIRGGNILPVQEPAVNTNLSRMNDMGLLIALDDDDKAVGSFYWDEGESLDPIETGAYFWADISMSDGTINYNVTMDGYPGMAQHTLGNITVMGGPLVSSILVNGVNHTDFNFDQSKNVLEIYSLGLVAKDGFVVEMS